MKSVSVIITFLQSNNCNASGVVNDFSATICCATSASTNAGLINANLRIIHNAKYKVLITTPHIFTFHARKRSLIHRAASTNIKNGRV